MEQRITILIIDNSPVLGGAELYTIELAQRADKDKYRFVFAVTCRDRIPFLKQKGFEYALFRTGKLKTLNPYDFMANIYRSIVDLRDIIARFNIDILQANTVRTHILGALAAVRSRKPVIWVHHQYDFVPLLFALFSFIPRKIVCVSETTRNYYERFLKQNEKLEVIYNGIDTALYQGVQIHELAGCQSIRNEIIVGMVGRIEERKGQEVLIRAIPGVIERMPHVKFYIVGDVGPGQGSYNDRIRKLVDDLHVGENVVFTGFVADIVSLMARLDVLVQPSVEPESFGRVLIEAMALGKPVIATDIGAFREIIENKKDGILVRPGDPREITSTLLRLLEDRQEAHAMGEAARRKVMEKYSLKRSIQQFEMMYEGLANQPRHS